MAGLVLILFLPSGNCVLDCLDGCEDSFLGQYSFDFCHCPALGLVPQGKNSLSLVVA